MKKVFLLLAAAFSGFAVMAGGVFTYNATTGVIEVPYNSYGAKLDSDTESDEWQGGNREVLDNAVFEVTQEAWGLPALGETFMVTIKGTADFTGTVKLFLVDEREKAGYFTKIADANGEFQVVAGQAFESTTVMTVTNNSICTNGDNSGKEVEGGLTEAGLVMLCAPNVTSTMEGFNSAAPMTITTTEFTVLWEAPVNIENPTGLTYKGVADAAADGFKYQGLKKASDVSTSAAPAGFVNVTVAGTAASDIATLMYSLIDQSADAKPKAYFSDVVEGGFATILANIKSGDAINVSFSLPVAATFVPGAKADYQHAFLAQDPTFAMNKYISNLTVTTTITPTAAFDAPSVETAVEDVVAANFAVENGVVTSEGQIVVYNVAGQVVATASQSFNVSSLSNGVYFITAQEGTIKFVK